MVFALVGKVPANATPAPWTLRPSRVYQDRYCEDHNPMAPECIRVEGLVV